MARPSSTPCTSIETLRPRSTSRSALEPAKASQTGHESRPTVFDILMFYAFRVKNKLGNLFLTRPGE
eukprot:762422-Hanusia_phi.AAC.5